MSDNVIVKSNEIINSKTGYIGGGMGGYAALSLIDENGYPTTSTLTIAKADGINWLTFCTSPTRNSVIRIKNCNRASVCINSSEYNLTLVGTVEILTDINTKKDNWMPVMDDGAHWTGPEDPNFCVLRFTTERYSLFIDDTGFVEGAIKNTNKKTTASIDPMFQFDRQCAQAIELYKKAFGAKIAAFLRYADANPKDLPPKYNAETDSNLVFHAQLLIGNQRIMLCDNVFNELQPGHTVYPVMMFKTADEVKAAYNVLADGATITTPIGSTTYSACVASLIDKFGVHWDLMVG